MNGTMNLVCHKKTQKNEMGYWFEEIVIFIFTYGWFFGLIPLILGIVGAVYFSYYPNVSY